MSGIQRSKEEVERQSKRNLEEWRSSPDGMRWSYEKGMRERKWDAMRSSSTVKKGKSKSWFSSKKSNNDSWW